jgi:APA family basic amino acid/polyamine antiporter
MFAVSRIIAAVARQHLLPPFLAKVHKRFGTPYISTALSGVATAVIALFTSFDELLNMVSGCCCDCSG